MSKPLTLTLELILLVAGCSGGSGCLNIAPAGFHHTWGRDRCEDSASCDDDQCAAKDPYRPRFDYSSHRCVPRSCYRDDCAQGAFCGQEGICLPFACHAAYEACVSGKPSRPVETCAELCQ